MLNLPYTKNCFRYACTRSECILRAIDVGMGSAIFVSEMEQRAVDADMT